MDGNENKDSAATTDLPDSAGQPSPEGTADTPPTIEELMTQIAQERAEKEKHKTALDKALRDISEKTKALRVKQTAEEQEDEAKREQAEAHKQYVSSLERKISVTDSVNRYLDMGMDKDMARKTAEAEVDKPDGYEDIISTNLKKLMEAKINAAKADWIKSRPDVQAGNDEEDGDPFLKGFGMK